MNFFNSEVKALVIYKKWESPNLKGKAIHEKSLKTIYQILELSKTTYKTCLREKLKDTSGFNTLISVGGDGTFLHSAHFYQKGQVIIGVNSAPKSSYGALCQLNAQNFKKYWGRLLENKLRFISIQRLSIEVNKHLIPYYPLNDVLFSNPCPAGTSRYILKIGKEKEEQKSSGLWVSSPKGSSGGIHSAGGLILKEEDKTFQFLVREPFLLQKQNKLLRGILKKEKKITLINQLSKAHLYLDGSHLYLNLNYKDEISLSLSQFPILTLPKNLLMRP